MQYAFCSVAAAPLRKEPAHRSEMTSQLLFGEGIQIIDQENEWLRVKCLLDGYEGFMTEPQVSEVPETVVQQPAKFVTTGFLNNLEKNGTTIQLPMGCSLPSLNERDKKIWNGFTYKGSYGSTAIIGSREQLLSCAGKWLHAPYLWGGRTFLGVDCSGFVQTVFKITGVPLLRDAWQQQGQGTLVTDREALHPGDVAFFHNEAGKIIHVGIILSGEKIIHASGTVRIDFLTRGGIIHSSSGKQTHTLHSIKRMLTDDG